MLRQSIAILFLTSYLVGIIQPVLPMMEYYLFKESIVELFCVNRDVPESDCEGSCYLADQMEKSNKKSGKSGTLINVEDIPIFILPGVCMLSRLSPPFEKLKIGEAIRPLDGVVSPPFHPPKG